MTCRRFERRQTGHTGIESVETTLVGTNSTATATAEALDAAARTSQTTATVASDVSDLAGTLPPVLGAVSDGLAQIDSSISDINDLLGAVPFVDGSIDGIDPDLLVDARSRRRSDRRSPANQVAHRRQHPGRDGVGREPALERGLTVAVERNDPTKTRSPRQLRLFPRRFGPSNAQRERGLRWVQIARRALRRDDSDERPSGSS